MLHRNPFQKFFPVLVGCMLALHALLLLVAGIVRSFVSGALSKITAERQGRPFILSLWPISFAHCPADIRTLGKLNSVTRSLDVALVSTDDPDVAARTAEIAPSYAPGGVSRWIFFDDVPERLQQWVRENLR